MALTINQQCTINMDSYSVFLVVFVVINGVLALLSALPLERFFLDLSAFYSLTNVLGFSSACVVLLWVEFDAILKMESPLEV